MRIDLNITEETVLLGFHGGRGETAARMVADGNNRIIQALSSATTAMMTAVKSCIFYKAGDGLP